MSESITPPVSSSPSGGGAPAVHFGFQNTYARLPARFYSRVHPAQVPAPRLVKLNRQLAQRLGLDPEALASPEGVAILAGNTIAAGSEPLAQAYAGHQFGNFVQQLGDGRANLLGEVAGVDGARYDIQLKGSGPTPFSRAGDGKAALGPVLREYIVSEAMAALGVPSTRSLAVVTTGEQVARETMLPGAVLTRVAASHLRVGTFEYFAVRRDSEALRLLADYAITRHFPEAAQAERPYHALLDAVISRQARLVAQWMMIGFIHGVMNTDNTSISGETIDYGPCAFMEAYDPATVFSAIDRQGRYAFGNQPRMMLWNLSRLAEALLPLLELHDGSKEVALESAKAALHLFAPQFEAAQLAGYRRKLGLFTEQAGDLALAQDLLTRMAANGSDYTLTFRTLCNAAADSSRDDQVRALFKGSSSFDEWGTAWRARLALESVSPDQRAEAMRQTNPLFIPRNHLVESVIASAVSDQDFHPFEELLDAISQPYEDRAGLERYARPALPEEAVRFTFCGT